jgi:hypothetical protein
LRLYEVGNDSRQILTNKIQTLNYGNNDKMPEMSKANLQKTLLANRCKLIVLHYGLLETGGIITSVTTNGGKRQESQNYIKTTVN